jgi:hypothetical protein
MSGLRRYWRLFPADAAASGAAFEAAADKARFGRAARDHPGRLRPVAACALARLARSAVACPDRSARTTPGHTSTNRPDRDESGLQMVWISRLFLAEGNGSEYRAAILEHLNLLCPGGPSSAYIWAQGGAICQQQPLKPFLICRRLSSDSGHRRKDLRTG